MGSHMSLLRMMPQDLLGVIGVDGRRAPLVIKDG